MRLDLSGAVTTSVNRLYEGTMDVLPETNVHSQSEETWSNIPTQYIILIATGGFLFLLGLVVLLALLRSKKNFITGDSGVSTSRRFSSPPPQSAIVDVIRSTRPGGFSRGDNPAFSRIEERSNGDLLSTRHMRLPTYEEVMSGCLFSTPVSSDQHETPSSSRRTNPPANQTTLLRDSPTSRESTSTMADNGQSRRVVSLITSQIENDPTAGWRERPPPPYSTEPEQHAESCIAVSHTPSDRIRTERDQRTTIISSGRDLHTSSQSELFARDRLTASLPRNSTPSNSMRRNQGRGSSVSTVPVPYNFLGAVNLRTTPLTYWLADENSRPQLADTPRIPLRNNVQLPVYWSNGLCPPLAASSPATSRRPNVTFPPVTLFTGGRGHNETHVDTPRSEHSRLTMPINTPILRANQRNHSFPRYTVHL